MSVIDIKELQDRIARLEGEVVRLVNQKASLEDQVRLMRGDLVETVGAIKGRDATIGKMSKMVEDLTLELAQTKRRLALYENPNTPPSQESVRRRRERSKRRQQAKEGGEPQNKPNKPGRKKGHQGTSHHRRSDRKVYRTPEACAHCGSADLTVLRDRTTQQVDIEPVVVHTTTVVSRECRCLDCGKTTLPETGSTPGTSLGPNLQSMVVRLWEDGVPVERTGRFVGELINQRVSGGAVQNCLAACSGRLEAEAQEIKASVAEASSVNIDETRIWVNGRMCHVWVFVTRYAVWYLVVGSRGAAVLDQHFPYPDIWVICDGYVVYDRFAVRQRCWAHILRKAEFLANHTDNRDSPARLLHLALQQLFVHAKDLAARGIMATHDDLVAEAASLADRYDDAGLGEFATELRNAAPYLFTFLLYPGMPPTNNLAEWGARKVVIQRKVRGQLKNPAGMKMFGTLLTCLTTWRMRGLNVMDKLRETLGAA